MILLKTKKDLLIKFPLGLLIIAFLGLSPIIVSMVGANITEWLTNEPCHEGNCFWGGFGWLFLVTIPVALILLLVFLIISLIDLIRLLRN